MIAGGFDIVKYGLFLELLYSLKADNSSLVANIAKLRTFHFSKLLEPLKELYDYIWIGVGSSANIRVDNVMVCAEYFVIP
ncbi:hypothetical protein IRB23SM22_21600 [Alkalibacterium sp. s-m-22]